ncbi:efflux RND transporter periplasmic adaptor subunit [Nafulsella turpanensis]|uniref:efflux RND transporter periplasmic adaptor subunit n=1 Tax=Nafulsella turpanensis TaxID=1265690 RepID=UPI000346F360|nr:efflux RND transporter periplasmic adaptor subunit [Nafulsella turpanensis]
MNKLTKRILTVVIILVVAFLIIYPKLDLAGNEGEEVAAAAAPAATGPLQVEVVVADPQPLENTVTITGSILANESVQLSPEMAGKITRISFEEGEYVKKGQPLIYLNDDELQAQLERLNYTRKLYEQSEERQRKLLEREAISQEEYDIALNELKTNVADIKVVEAQLEKSIVRAPFSGTIGLREVSEGSYVTPADNIATLVSIDPVKVEFSVPERYANEVGVGDQIAFTRSENSDVVRTGKVYAVEPRINTETRTLTMRALSENDDRKLLPGMFVRIKLVLDVNENSIMVPAQALIPEMNGYKVYVVEEGKAVEKRVDTGVRTSSQVEVTSGLVAGDSVLTTGILQVKNGAPVQVKDVVLKN